MVIKGKVKIKMRFFDNHSHLNDEKFNIDRKKFAQFTKEVWTQETTDDEVGSWLDYQIFKKLDIDHLYMEVKNQYDVLYKEMKIEVNSKIMICLICVLTLALIFNVLNYFRIL